jgi:hypothetical protein
MVVSELTMQMLDRAIGGLFGHLAALPLAIEMKLHSFCGSHNSLPPRPVAFPF